MINRDLYLNRIIRNMWNGEIKVITGIRRCGKSVLLFDLFYEYLISQGVPEDHILKIELDQRRNYKFRNPVTLCEYVEDLVTKKSDEKYYLFIDEVQLTLKIKDRDNDGIEISVYDMLNELKAYKNLDVYVTGSNSKGLSKDIATEFRGRATRIHIFPLSFKEFYSYVGGDEQKALDSYMLYGGMPRLLSLPDEKDKKDYLSSLYDELYIRDIVERNGIEREDILNEILDFLASQISSLTNPANIANALSSTKKEKVNSVLVSNYIGHITDSFLISVAKRYDVKGKDVLAGTAKYYMNDLAYKNFLYTGFAYGIGYKLENLVFLQLKRAGYVVYTGAAKNKEVDFVGMKDDRLLYIQVTYSLQDEQTAMREYASLETIRDNYEKVIVSLDDSVWPSNKGIRHMQAWNLHTLL